MKATLIKTENGYGLIDCELIAFVSSVRKVHRHHKLSLENCLEIEHGYNLDDLAQEWIEINGDKWSNNNNEVGDNYGSFISGFNKCLEIFSNRKYSLEDLKESIKFGQGMELWKEEDQIQKWIDSLSKKKSWSVEVLMEPCYYDDSLSAFSTSYSEGKPKEQPKLDEDGCLILKKINEI